MGHDFQFGSPHAGTEHKPVASGSAESNGVIETIHRSMGVVIRIFVNEHPPQTLTDVQDLVETALASAMHATRTTSNSALDFNSPGSLVFRRDMFLDMPFQADLLALHTLRQQKIDNRLILANSKRLHHEFKVGDPIVKRTVLTASDKLRPTGTGPHRIETVHHNGTVAIRLNQHQRERVNIRRMQPFRSQAPQHPRCSGCLLHGGGQ